MIPYDHWVLDDFFPVDIARELSNQFPDYNEPNWHWYNNPLENKKAKNHWYEFPPLTYQVFAHLNSAEFLDSIREITGIQTLYPDVGLHGGGWHMHSRGGKLNIHLDYVINPKLDLQRKLNLIIYLTEDWDTSWGGGLELWSHNEETNLPDKREVVIDNIFNRAILFDTTQNSWHGLPQPITCPEGVYRKSIAVYYMTDLPEDTNQRKRALYAPTKEQANDSEVLDFIKERVTWTSK